MADAAAYAFAEMMALLIRFDFYLDMVSAYALRLHYIPLGILVTVAVFAVFRLYNSIWRYASVDEYARIVMATVVSTALNHLIRWVISLFAVNTVGSMQLRGCTLSAWFILFFVVFSGRMSARLVADGRSIGVHMAAQKNKETNIMIIGAGAAGNLLLREIQQNGSLQNRQVVCMIDDDHEKTGRCIRGVHVVGNRFRIPEAVNKYAVDEIIFAIPSALPSEKASILSICKELSCPLKVMPSLTELVKSEPLSNTLREVDIEDLLGRDPIDVDLSKIAGYVRGRVVLVTGGCGSIGSELCRQVARYDPKRLIIFDIYENNAYYIQNELKAHYPQLNLAVLIGSVRDVARLDNLFETYHPEIVFHAAAHKHVPLMEDSPNESVKNNVFGTLNMVKAADRWGVSRFVMISTDKAVNPTNVMGATKRICEMIIQTWNDRSKTDYVAVRFGNVLGSNGSVIPLFEEQIKAGGPVCVTHPDIIRYFMTIPEAVSLVLAAGALAQGGEIFVLDMGKPVKILDLAENLIRLSGHVPNGDIKIAFTGLRPGEKLYEELLMSEEGLSKTESKLVYIGHPIAFDEQDFLEKLERLRCACQENTTGTRQLISDIVTTYRYSSENVQTQENKEPALH